MKLMIASDIHGAAGYCRALLDAFDRERADRLLLLGGEEKVHLIDRLGERPVEILHRRRFHRNLPVELLHPGGGLAEIVPVLLHK